MTVTAKAKQVRASRCAHSARMLSIVLVLSTAIVSPAYAQPPAMPPLSIGDGSYVFDTAEAGQIRVDVISNELTRPWGMAFLPNGNLLVTEGPGRLRLFRSGKLDPQSFSGVPEVFLDAVAGQPLQEITLHPDFENNQLVYLTYMKPLSEDDFSPAILRARLDLDHMALLNTKDIFVAETHVGGLVPGMPMIFAPDGTILMGIGAAEEEGQDTGIHNGKFVRLNDDGSIPDDNPFVNRRRYLPEIFSLGHRNMLGLAIHPETGEVWESENGPNGGDEINILKSGANYGWPLVSFGRQYTGPRVSERTHMDGMEGPVNIWIPSIAVSGMIFYTGDRFPAWKNNLLAGGLNYGRIAGTGVLDRIVYNEDWDEVRRETMLSELRQRIRNIEQGPDGLLYIVTDEEEGALLRISPAAN